MKCRNIHISSPSTRILRRCRQVEGLKPLERKIGSHQVANFSQTTRRKQQEMQADNMAMAGGDFQLDREPSHVNHREKVVTPPVKANRLPRFTLFSLIQEKSRLVSFRRRKAIPRVLMARIGTQIQKIHRYLEFSAVNNGGRRRLTQVKAGS